MVPNRSRYLASVSEELRAQATRVRDLIGDKHWLSDGHHKEYLVKHAFARHVPAGVAVSRGFVAHPQRSDLISREQDLVFVDTFALAPVFDQGGLCIAFPQQTLAAIAVKTTFSTRELADACDTLHSVRQVAHYAGMTDSPWCGVLFFESDTTPEAKWCEKIGRTISAFEQKAESLSSMRSAPDIVAIAGVASFLVDSVDASTRDIRVRGFSGDGLVVLLNSLLSHLATCRDSNGAPFEQFAGSLVMTPLPGSPFTPPST